MNVKGAQVVVVGMARSGQAAVELLLEQQAQVRAVDHNPAPITIRGEHWVVEQQTPSAFERVDLVVLSPGVPADLTVLEDLRKRGIPVIGDLELASWFLKGKVIGITGSNGKTTTTALTGHILQSAEIPVQVGGNIGQAPCSMVNSSSETQWNVLELSSFQLETIQSFRANIATVLNVTPDHLDRHYTLERYAAAKGRIFENQEQADCAVLNADDAICTKYSTHGDRLCFSSTKSDTRAYLSGDSVHIHGEHLLYCREVPLRGVHNLENVMAAALIACAAGAGLADIRDAIITFPGVEHRLEFVCEFGGVNWYNDSKATNVDATLKAIAAFDGGLWVILGGKDKNSDYTPLAGPLKEKARGVFLIGTAANKIEAQLKGALPMIHAGTLEIALAQAATLAKRGDTVLLAPACASFDQFQNFEHRGHEFKRLVRELKGQTPEGKVWRA